MSYTASIQRQNPQDQLDLFSALEKVREAADKEWWEAALKAVKNVCLSQAEFTSDDVWKRLEGLSVTTKEPRAMGAVMREADSRGWIKFTGGYVKSRQKKNHRRPVAVWRSLRFPLTSTPAVQTISL